MNRLWKPQSAIRFKIQKYLDNAFGQHLMIGIQLRYRYLNDTLDTLKFIECARYVEDLLLVANSAKDIRKSTKSVKWFVTSDRADILARFKTEYGDKVVITDGYVGHIYEQVISIDRFSFDMCN